MSRQTDGGTNKLRDGWTDRWMKRWTDRQMDAIACISEFCILVVMYCQRLHA